MRPAHFIFALFAARSVLALPAPVRRGFLDSIVSAVDSAASEVGSAVGAAASEVGDTVAALNPFSTTTPAASAPGDPNAPTPLDANATAAALLRPALFVQAAYCSSDAVTQWQCGPPCDALGKDVEVLVAGGDNGETPRFYVAHDKSENRIIVAHQGTDAKSVLSIANDLKFTQRALNSTLFPNVSDAVQVHNGFADTQERTAELVLGGVLLGIQQKNATSVLVVGHSLGAAVAMFDSMMLARMLPANVSMQTVTFGQPRSGNQAWADLVDSTLSNVTAITNQNDPVPLVAPKFLGFAHSSHEVHIAAIDSTTAAPTSMLACPGQDNEGCSNGNNVLKASADNHKGPYFQSGIVMAAAGCPA